MKSYETNNDKNAITAIFNPQWHDLPGRGRVLRGEEKIRGVMVRRSFHRDDIISPATHTVLP